MEHTNCSTSIYTSNDAYCQGSAVNVPFSWEYKPGLSKVTHHDDESSNNNGTRGGGNLVLQPPPCSSSFGTRSDDTHVHLGLLCAIQPSSLRISSFRMESTPKEEDPFVEAYKKCTKSPFMLLQSSTSNSRGLGAKVTAFDNRYRGFNEKSSRGQKTNYGSWPSIRKYMHILSCKYAGDVSIGKPVCTYKDVKEVEKL